MPNPIVTENQLPGSPQSEWFQPPGDHNPNIGGFATRPSVNRGQTIDFKIKTVATSWQIDIYRLGYYGGNGARKMTTIVRNAPATQPNPHIDLSIGLWDASNWSVTASWAVPATAVSGVYTAKLTRTDGVGGYAYIPFVVRHDGAQRDIVFQTSDTTWQAYNGWGGANLYGGNATTGTPTGRAFKVSLNRPYSTREGNGGTDAGPQDYVFSAELAMIRWLERNGYDVAYCTGHDVGPGNYTLTNHNLYLSVGHDEYWSKDQRERVEAARDAGVHLAFFSGNEVYWKVRWEPDVAGTPNRVMVCYKETRANAKIDPSAEWTGTWRDPSFSPPSTGGKPENSLTGTIFHVDSHQGDQIEIPNEYRARRFWRNTQIATTPSNQIAFIEPGSLGYEWDGSPNDKWRPQGLIHLSSTFRDIIDKRLIDYGTTTANGPATHHLTLYKAPSGAMVFGAGTVFWPFVLDTVHDWSSTGGPTNVPEDRDAQQATVNLFADMGIQPETLQVNLTPAAASTDTTPPVSVITTPTNGASFVQQSAVTISGTASDVGGVVSVVEVSTDNGQSWLAATGTTNWTFTWYPQLPGSYTIKVRAVDDSLNMESPGQSRTVTVTPAGTVRLFQPTDVPYNVRSNDENPVQVGMKFTVNTAGSATGIRFYKNTWNTGVHWVSLWNASTQARLAHVQSSGETANGWQQVNFAGVALTPGVTYIVSYHTNQYYNVDANYFLSSRTCGAITAPSSATSGGNGVFGYGSKDRFPDETFLNSNYWVDVVFARAGGAGNLPPNAVSNTGFTTPLNTALNISEAALLANDSDPNGYPISISSVQSPVNGTVSYNAGTKIVTFTPTNGFSGAASFQYTITNGFLQSSATVTLNVGAAMVTQSLFGPSDTPALLNSTDNGPVELGMKFRCTVAGASVTGMKFYKGTMNTGPHTGRLWSGSTVLATATFSGETASGWQTATFPAPVQLTQNQTYVISYHTTTKYSSTSNGFASDRVSGQLVAPSSASSGGNGVFTYGPAGSQPVSTFGATNYFVDVIAQVPQQPAAPQTLFLPSDVPAIPNSNDVGPIQLGVKFRTSAVGATATGIKFYKGTTNTGPHTAHLFNSTGTLLATASFSGETASGWQTAMFTTPVALTANTIYIASYHTGTTYSVTNNYFSVAKTSGSLTAPASVAGNGNGVFKYGAAGSFPDGTFNATNYWVDVIVQA